MGRRGRALRKTGQLVKRGRGLLTKFQAKTPSALQHVRRTNKNVGEGAEIGTTSGIVAGILGAGEVTRRKKKAREKALSNLKPS